MAKPIRNADRKNCNYINFLLVHYKIAYYFCVIPYKIRKSEDNKDRFYIERYWPQAVNILTRSKFVYFFNRPTFKLSILPYLKTDYILPILRN